MGASAIRIGPHTTASSPPRERRGSRLRGRSNLLPTAGLWRRLVLLRTARSSSWPHGDRTARSRSGRARRVPSSRSSGRRPGRPSSPAGRGVAPGLVGQAIVQRFRRARFLGSEDAVDVPLVQRPVEDPPVPAIQKGNRLPERLEQAGVVEAVEQFPVLRLDRVVDDLGPESEVAHDRAGLGQGLGTGAAQALFDGAGQRLYGDHVFASRSRGNLGPRRFYRFAGLWPESSSAEPPFFGSDSRGPTFILSRLNIAKHLLSRPAGLGHSSGSMRRKSGKAIVDLDKEPPVVHFNVGSGYVSYLEKDAPEHVPRVKSVVISRDAI